jgi:3-hydroxybutyrate dehydrogenase
MLRNKCALVTGSVAGLGYAIAESLARSGANVVLNALCDAADGRAAAAKLAKSAGVEVAFDGADLRDVADIERMMRDAAARFGGVDIVVNNAVVRHFAPIDKMTTEQWNTSLAVNLSAGFHCVRLALPAMREKNWGRIVNMSSIYGSRGAENRIDYVTTKTALIGMTRAIAVETARTGITCNAVCPGVVPSPAIVDRIAGIAAAQGISHAQAERDYLSPRNPTKRFVALESVGALVTFLCSPAGQDITGAVLPVDGGWLAR